MSYVIPFLVLGLLAITISVFANTVKNKDITLPESVEMDNDRRSHSHPVNNDLLLDPAFNSYREDD